MKMYTKPEFDIIKFDAEDVICSSELQTSVPKTIVGGKEATALSETNVSVFEY